jgi:hypothetical protein
LRPTDEIIRAHDILLAVSLGEIGQIPNEATFHALEAALDVLCWVLRHEHNPTFAANLATLEAFIAEQGYGLVERERVN